MPKSQTVIKMNPCVTSKFMRITAKKWNITLKPTQSPSVTSCNIGNPYVDSSINLGFSQVRRNRKETQELHSSRLKDLLRKKQLNLQSSLVDGKMSQSALSTSKAEKHDDDPVREQLAKMFMDSKIEALKWTTKESKAPIPEKEFQLNSKVRNKLEMASLRSQEVAMHMATTERVQINHGGIESLLYINQSMESSGSRTSSDERA